MSDRKGDSKKPIYTGISREQDLRDYLLKLAEDLEETYAGQPGSTADGSWNVRLPRHRVRQAADVIRRAAKLNKLAGLFPEHLANHQPDSKRFWRVVDALHSGVIPTAELSRRSMVNADARRKNMDLTAKVSRRWNVKPDTLRKNVTQLATLVRSMFDFPLHCIVQEELEDTRRQLLKMDADNCRGDRSPD